MAWGKPRKTAHTYMGNLYMKRMALHFRRERMAWSLCGTKQLKPPYPHEKN